MAPPRDREAVLHEFRNELVQQGLLHDGDSIGTDDETLSYVNGFVQPVYFYSRPTSIHSFIRRRFLRARHYNLKQSILMWKNCQHWRSTVEDVGIDQLYRDIDPFDVRLPPYTRLTSNA